MTNAKGFIVDGMTLATIKAVAKRLNDDRTLAPGEKFDLGRMTEAAITAIENGALVEVEPEWDRGCPTCGTFVHKEAR